MPRSVPGCWRWGRKLEKCIFWWAPAPLFNPTTKGPTLFSTTSKINFWWPHYSPIYPDIYHVPFLMTKTTMKREFFGQKGVFWSKMTFLSIVTFLVKTFFGQKWFLCSKVTFLVKSYFFGQKWLFWSKVTCWGQKGFFGQKRLFGWEMQYLVTPLSEAFYSRMGFFKIQKPDEQRNTKHQFWPAYLSVVARDITYPPIYFKLYI